MCTVSAVIISLQPDSETWLSPSCQAELETRDMTGAQDGRDGGKEGAYRVTRIMCRRGWAIDQIKFEYRCSS